MQERRDMQTGWRWLAGLAVAGWLTKPWWYPRVRTLVEDAARAVGGIAAIDDALLDEVTALVEWPVPICGSRPCLPVR